MRNFIQDIARVIVNQEIELEKLRGSKQILKISSEQMNFNKLFHEYQNLVEKANDFQNQFEVIFRNMGCLTLEMKKAMKEIDDKRRGSDNNG